MYYALPPTPSTQCTWDIHYATSEDGLFFTGARTNPVLTASQQAWAQAITVDVMGVQTQVYAGINPAALLVDPDSHAHTLWVTAEGVEPNRTNPGCFAIGFGRATRQ
jgi:hypothetical protein